MNPENQDGHPPRATQFGDTITADHKILIDEGASRLQHRSAIMVQDLATRWLQSYQCKPKTSQETRKSLWKFLEPEEDPKVVDIQKIPWNLSKLVKTHCDLQGRKINFTNSKTLVGWLVDVATERNASVTLACVSFHLIFLVFFSPNTKTHQKKKNRKTSKNRTKNKNNSQKREKI